MSRSNPYNSGIPVVSYDAHECLRLLRRQQHAAVEAVPYALPAVLSVPYVVDGTDVLLETAPGTAGSLVGTTVAVSVDVDDDVTGAVWRVVVVGKGQAVGGRLRLPVVGPVAFWICAGSAAPDVAVAQRKVWPSPR